MIRLSVIIYFRLKFFLFTYRLYLLNELFINTYPFQKSCQRINIPSKILTIRIITHVRITVSDVLQLIQIIPNSIFDIEFIRQIIPILI